MIITTIMLIMVIMAIVIIMVIMVIMTIVIILQLSYHFDHSMGVDPSRQIGECKFPHNSLTLQSKFYHSSQTLQIHCFPFGFSYQVDHSMGGSTPVVK